MPKIKYIEKRFNKSSWLVIESANKIIEEYAGKGFSLTLRQLYYQFVARDLIPNRNKEYKRIASIINDARLAGHVDWNAIHDMTRNLSAQLHHENEEDAIAFKARTFKLDKWENQRYRPEVWIEKDALVGIITGVCYELDVPYFSCRGYTSQSEMWRAYRRCEEYAADGQTPIIFHFGDHDPSGMDMSRDIVDRFETFGHDLEFLRLALNMDQIETFNPPPNPAKLSDSRCRGYISKFGRSSWELDSMPPEELEALIRAAILSIRDEGIYEATVEEETVYKTSIARVSDNWSAVDRFLTDE